MSHYDEKKDIGGDTYVLEDASKHGGQHVENNGIDSAFEDRQGAIRAEELERSQGIKEAFQNSPWAVFWSFAVSLCIIMEGYDTALPGNFLGYEAYRKRFGHWTGEENGYQLTTAWQNGLGQASGVGSILAIFVASYFVDIIGYRRILQIGLAAMFCFIFICFFAVNAPMLLVGYHLCGWAWGTFQATCVAYSSELCPVALRGYLTTYVNLCWIIGQFIAAGVLYAMSGRQDEWAYRIPFAIQWIWPIPLIILIQYAPESPWFLVRKGRLDEAAKNIARIAAKNSTVDPHDVVAMMVRTNEKEMEMSSGVSYIDCFKGTDARRSMIAMAAWLAQNTVGLPFAGQAIYYFTLAGIDQRTAFALGIGNTAMAFVGTVLSWFLLARFGRRDIFLWGCVALASTLYMLAGLTFPAEKNTKVRLIQAVLMMIWIFLFDLTVGPLAYGIVGEASSTRLRGKTVALARNAYNIWGTIAGVLMTYMLNPTAWNWGGKTGFFWAGMATLTAIWTFFCLPEMKGRTYRELDILFERRISARKFKETIVNAEDDH